MIHDEPVLHLSPETTYQSPRVIVPMEAFVIGLSLEAFRVLAELLLAETILTSVIHPNPGEYYQCPPRCPYKGSDLREIELEYLDRCFKEDCAFGALWELDERRIIDIAEMTETICRYVFRPERDWGVEPGERGVCEPEP